MELGIECFIVCLFPVDLFGGYQGLRIVGMWVVADDIWSQRQRGAPECGLVIRVCARMLQRPAFLSL